MLLLPLSYLQPPQGSVVAASAVVLVFVKSYTYVNDEGYNQRPSENSIS